MEKICKECGQPFIPTKPRQKYCERKHFRPCPGCGKQIEIKWLSNPTPKCDECRKHRTRKKIQVITDEIISETDVLKLSASAINTYLSCPKKYYYKHLLNLK